MTTARPSRRVAVARLRRLARYLETLSEREYDQASCTRCVIGHTRRFFKLGESRISACEYLGIPPDAQGPIVGELATVRTPRGKAKQLRALAARLAKGE